MEQYVKLTLDGGWGLLNDIKFLLIGLCILNFMQIALFCAFAVYVVNYGK